MHEFLPLTPFEELVFWTDRPAYPANCFVHLRFDGTFVREALECALKISLERHPLLTARIKKQGRRFGWTWDHTPTHSIQWIEPKASDHPRSRRFDLLSEPGLRIDAIERAGGSELFIHFHHSCCDGKGIERFVNDLLISYTIERYPDQDNLKLSPVDHESLRTRGRHHWAALRSIRKWPRQAVGLLGALQFVSRRPSCAVKSGIPSDDNQLCDQYPTWATHRLDADSLQKMRRSARSKGVSLNDLICRDVFLAVSRWRQSIAETTESQWLRMMVPVNLRTKEDRNLSAANMVSSVFLDRRPSDCANPDALLKSIQDEMELIKNLELGLTFPQTLALSRLVPDGLKRTANRGNRISFIFSNVGVVSKAPFLPKVDGYTRYGDVVLREIYAAVPITDFTNIAFFAHQYAKQLWLTLHFDANVVTRDQANALVEILGEQFARTMK